MPVRSIGPWAARHADGTPIAYSYIRFSSLRQEEGDSVRRQVEATRAWAARNNVPLDESLQIDRGVSAFRGKNRDIGALGEFLRLVERGVVRPGSYLVVENLDRLSRDELDDAVQLLLGMTSKGVRVVALSPAEMVFQKPVNMTQLIIAIVELSRGHSESKVKSERITAAWTTKRGHARESGALMTGRLPAWLKVVAGRPALIPERAQALRRIFALAAAGYGITRIIARLNAEGVAAFGGRARKVGDGEERWCRTYVEAILHDRRAVGEYQPRVRR